MRLQNRIALVTGAGSGLGRAGALALAREGARVVVSDLDPSSTDTTVATIREAGGEAVGIPADAGDRAQARHLIDETVAVSAGSTFSTTTRESRPSAATVSRPTSRRTTGSGCCA